MAIRRKYKSSLPTKFNSATERQRLLDEPGRAHVEDIAELRSRPDPKTDAFLGQAAREAGFKGDVGFGSSNDESWGVNPRRTTDKGAAMPSRKKDPRKTLNQQFGGTDFTGRSGGSDLPGPNTREGNMPPAGSGGRAPMTAHTVGERSASLVGYGMGKAADAFIGTPARIAAGYHENVGQPFAGAYQKYVGRPFEDFARGFTGFDPVSDGGQSGAVDTAEAAPPKSPAEFDTEQENTDERALNDPMSGNPNRSRFADMHPPVTDGGAAAPEAAGRSAFGENIYARPGADGRLSDFTNVAPGGEPQFAGGDAMSGGQAAAAFGAPGSSGMPGPGGTVNTISSEAFTSPGGEAAGEAAAARARRDFMLRREGNAHLASDATPEEIRAGKKQEVRQQIQNLNLGLDQSLGSLMENRQRYQRLTQELGNIQREEELGMQAETKRAELESTAKQNALDRASEERQAVLENTLGGMPSGRTMEAVRNQIATRGYDSLTKDQKMLFEQEVRETLVENSLTELTPEELDKKVSLILGELSSGTKKVGLTLEGKRVQMPDKVVKALEKAYNENPNAPKTITIRGNDGSVQYWTIDPETQRPMQVEGPQ